MTNWMSIYMFNNQISAISYRFVENRLIVSPYSVVITVAFGFMYPWCLAGRLSHRGVFIYYCASFSAMYRRTVGACQRRNTHSQLKKGQQKQPIVLRNILPTVCNWKPLLLLSIITEKHILPITIESEESCMYVLCLFFAYLFVYLTV